MSPGSEPAKTYDATSPWCWMWLRSRPSSPSIRPMSWNSSKTTKRAVATGRLEPERQLEQRVERGERVPRRLELEPRADPERAERQPDPGALQECLDAAPRSSPFSCFAYARSSRTVTSAIDATRYSSITASRRPISGPVVQAA